jgi:hypothetical protein
VVIKLGSLKQIFKIKQGKPKTDLK